MILTYDGFCEWMFLLQDDLMYIVFWETGLAQSFGNMDKTIGSDKRLKAV